MLIIFTNIFIVLFIVLAIYSVVSALRAANGKDTNIWLSKKEREKYLEKYNETEVLRFHSWFGFVEAVTCIVMAAVLFFGINSILVSILMLIPVTGRGYVARSERFRW